ncbi:hypothetical protein ma829 [Moumouvirus australiensis]|uniref:Uncharacterized protein n=1 Tax=Moumouvirus australiensis TaxID=2109587 RepID=A0A2P1EMT0_9VIRU|nr:hypothetical protein QKC55_gp075 [Moumouvirus australiensis]AVL95216.1 hypothetical protein ma829 [Moumouvirus australiensis]
MTCICGITSFDDFTFSFKDNTIFVFHEGKNIGSVHHNTQNLPWICEYNASKKCLQQIKEWSKYCKDQCYHDHYDEHDDYCEFPKELEKIISCDPNINTYKNIISWYGRGGLASALIEFKKCWNLLKDIN